MTLAFLDTAYLIALESVNNQYHKNAKKHFQRFLKNEPELVTSTYIIDETVTFFNNRNKHSKAVKIGESLLTSPSVDLIHVDENLFLAGWLFFKNHSDKTYSLTDCISFVLMEQRDLYDVLTFDHQFV